VIITTANGRKCISARVKSSAKRSSFGPQNWFRLGQGNRSVGQELADVRVGQFTAPSLFILRYGAEW
jgi:hypothetical protein